MKYTSLIIIVLVNLLNPFTIVCQVPKSVVNKIKYQPNTNLFLPLPNSNDSADLADPCAFKVDSTWYLTGTNGNDFKIWSTTDLVNWKYQGIIWEPIKGTWNDHGLIWAPHIQPADTCYYLYYTANRGIGVAYSKSPIGPYKEVYDHPLIGHGYGGYGDGKFNSSKNLDGSGLLWYAVKDLEEFVIDAFVLKATDGSLTLYYSQATPFTNIAAIPLKDYVTLSDAKPKKVLKAGIHVLSWEYAVREGPWVIELDSILYLMYSGNRFYTKKYAIGVAVAKQSTGNFKRYKHNPILKTDIKRNIFGPGHNSVVEGANNDLLMFYHVRTSKKKKQGTRLTSYTPIHFDKSGNIKIDLK